jgi:hypothetical protein
MARRAHHKDELWKIPIVLPQSDMRAYDDKIEIQRAREHKERENLERIMLCKRMCIEQCYQLL